MNIKQDNVKNRTASQIREEIQIYEDQIKNASKFKAFYEEKIKYLLEKLNGLY